MQLRRSPGGSMLKSLRKPAGGTAVVGDGDDRGKIGDLSWNGMVLAGGYHMTAKAAQQSGEAGAAADGDHAHRAEQARRRRRRERVPEGVCRFQGSLSSKQALRNLRIQQFRKARVISHALEVVVHARLQPVLGIHLDGAGKVVEALLRLPGDRVEHGQAVDRRSRPQDSRRGCC